MMNGPQRLGGAGAVLVTGVASGIGRAIAERLIADGYAVVGLDIANTPPPGLSEFVLTDLSDHHATAPVVSKLAERHGFTRLVNNVGSSRREFLRDGTDDTQRWLDRLNLSSALVCLQAVLPAMRSGGFGRVVNVTSRAALGRDNRSAYAATKGGLAAMTRVWAVELAATGITVNAVGPGMIDTELFRHNNPPDAPDVARLRESVPMKRLGLPEEVADAVAFFLGHRASYVTGQTIYACGGLSITGGRPGQAP
ncbi:3-ketoacyl-ACP reductase (plasmid) [Antarctobacter heliothermus]|uniref:3-ketoacyl-ACP reductase n=1 Tax=Antarctobacter heliothermus TaxID=74033 RepID=A0A222EBJ2_9RHOB|nr:SDR family oxidoreductase [Antarctobacter heliothermus]ASP23559.1 3-ketoacyl-ACP reductase [Antarctobacter heliothermus]